jgi:hypothetical protein
MHGAMSEWVRWWQNEDRHRDGPSSPDKREQGDETDVGIDRLTDDVVRLELGLPQIVALLVVINRTGQDESGGRHWARVVLALLPKRRGRQNLSRVMAATEADGRVPLGAGNFPGRRGAVNGWFVMRRLGTKGVLSGASAVAPASPISMLLSRGHQLAHPQQAHQARGQ